MFSACQHVMQSWMMSPGGVMPGYLQAPPFFCPMGPPMGSFPMPNPGWGCPFPFFNPFQGMAPPTPFQPPCHPGFGGYQPSVPNYGASYRYPEYGMLQERARENGTLDGTPVTPRSGFAEDRFHTEALHRLAQRAEGRVHAEARQAQPREFNALQRHEGQLQNYLRQQAEQGQIFNPTEVRRMRAEGVEVLYQEGQVGQGIGQANREYLELLEAWDRSQANQDLKYGAPPQPGPSRQAYQQSPFNAQRENPPARPAQTAPQAPPQPRPQLASPRPAPTAAQQQDIRKLDAPRPQATQPTQGRPAAGQPASPQPRAYDPNKDANALYKAMHGGLTGLGTDEDAIFKALQGKSQAEIDKLKANYKDHYGRDLSKDLQSELSGKDYQRAQALMSSNQAAADATAVRQGIGTLWNDNAQIHQALAGKTQEERAALAAEYKKQTGKELKTDLTREMSGTHRDQATALLEGNQAKADAARLQRAMKGAGTDEAAIMETLKGKSQQEREAINAAFKQSYGNNKVDLNTRLAGDLSGAELDQAKALLAGNNAAADAAALKHAMHGGLTGLGTDKDAIEKALAGKSEQERKDILAAYGKYGDLRADLKGDLSGNDLQKADALLNRGKLSEAEQLKFAMEGAGTDEEAIKQALQGKSKEEVARIRQEYQGLTNRSLDSDLASDMDGRDLFDARQALKGRAETIDEAVQRANEVRAFERGGEGNSVSRGVMDLFSEKGEILDRNTDRINASKQRFESLVAQGRLDEAQAEKQRLQELTGFQTSDVENYREAKDSAADTAGTIAATAAGVAVVVATAGTATPLVATAAMAAGAGAGARVVTSGLIQGQGYGLEAGLTDGAMGAIDGGTAIIGMGGATTARAAVKAGQEGAELAARETLEATGRIAVKATQEGGEVLANTGTRALLTSGQEAGEQAVTSGARALITSGQEGAETVAKVAINKADERLVIQTAGDLMEGQSGQFVRQRMVQGAKDGAVGGVVGGGGAELVRDDTWENGLSNGLTRVATGAALGGAAGGLAGGGMSRFGAAKEWGSEVDLYRNRANFNLFDDTQKARFADLAQNHSRGPAFLDGGPSQNVDSRLISMLRDGTVDKMDHTGATMVDNLHRLDNQQMAQGLTNRGVMDEVLETVHRPGVIHQDTKGSCTVTTLEYLHVKKDPADYVRVVGDLTSQGGETTLKNGERVLRNPTGLAPDGTSRSSIDRIYQSTMMDYGGGGHYDNVVDGHVQLNGKAGDSGLNYRGYNRVEEGVLGGQWKNVDFDNAAPQAREAFEAQVAKVTAEGDQVPIAMRFANDPGDMHANHMLSVYKTDDEYVYLRNPWGKGDTGGKNGPPREVLDREGNIRMKKSDFYDRLLDYDVQTSTQSRKVDLGQIKDDMTQKFRRQMEEYSDDRWMDSTPDFVWEKWTPEQRELHRSKLHDRAKGILDDLEASGNVRDVAEKYNLTDYYQMGDRHGRSEQFINRTEGGSNIHGVDKSAPKP